MLREVEMHMSSVWLALLVSLFAPQLAVAQFEVSQDELTTALLALPRDLRAEAAVFSFATDGRRIEHRSGTNGFACRTDDRTTAGLSLLCYQESLLPYESRRRRLANSEKDLPFTQVIERLDQEVASGGLGFPEIAARYYLNAPDGCFDSKTGTLCGAAKRFYELVTPWQTGASLGLPEEEGSGPWLMFSGGIMAHVMVELPLEEGAQR
jgi:hypothetical protein